MNNTTDLDFAILKTITHNKKIGLDFANECDTKLLSNDVWNFGNAVVSYLKTYKEVPTLRVLLEKSDNLKKEYLTKIWNSLESFSYDEKEYLHDLSKLKKRYADKELAQLSDRLQKAKENGSSFDINKQLAEIQKVVFNVKALEKTRSYNKKTLKDSIAEFRDEYNAKLTNPSFEAGIPTGYSTLDNATGGLIGGEMLIIAGESNSGKSMMLMNMAIQMFLQKNTIETATKDFTTGCNVLYFSLEMPFKSCRNRVYARLSGTPSKHIRNASLNKENGKKLTAALRFIDNYPFNFEIVDIPRGATVRQIEAIYEDTCLRYKPDVVVIDYLGLMSSENVKEQDDWLALGVIAGELHEMLRVHNVIGLTAVQLNRAKGNSKDSDERIGLSRIGRSALIATHANIVLQLETRPNEKQYPDINCHLIKSRESELTKFKMLKNLACGIFQDILEEKSEDVGIVFTDVEDISNRAELLDI